MEVGGNPIRECRKASCIENNDGITGSCFCGFGLRHTPGSNTTFQPTGNKSESQRFTRPQPAGDQSESLRFSGRRGIPAPHHPRFSSYTGLRKGRLLLCAADHPSAAAPRPSEGYEQPDAGMGASLCGDYRSSPFRVQGTHAGCFPLFYSQSNPPANH